MNKKELVAKAAQKTGLMKKDVDAVVDAVVEEITQALAESKKVQIMGFGTFELRKRAARKGQNPRTGETIQMPEALIPAFRAGKCLKEAVKK